MDYYLPDNAPTIPCLVSQADERLFRSVVSNPSHVLRDLLPPQVKLNQSINESINQNLYSASLRSLLRGETVLQTSAKTSRLCPSP